MNVDCYYRLKCLSNPVLTRRFAQGNQREIKQKRDAKAFRSAGLELDMFRGGVVLVVVGD